MKLESLLLFVVAMSSQACASQEPARPTEYPPIAPSAPVPAELLTPTPPPPRASQGESPPDPSQQAATETEGPAFADAPAKPLGPEEINVLVYARPLSLDAVRFDAIDKFLLLYAPYTANKALLRETMKAFRVARGLLATPLSSVPLSSSLAELVALLKPNPRTGFPAANLPAFVGALQQGVALTKNVVADFHEQVRDRLRGEGSDLLCGQIGCRPGDDSIASNNLRHINEWMKVEVR